MSLALWLRIIISCRIIKCVQLAEQLNLPKSHLNRFFNAFGDEAESFESAVRDQYGYNNKSLCWGYESICPSHLGYSKAHCPADHRGWVQTKSQQRDVFFEQADFGYIKNQIMTKKLYCQPQSRGDSHLECSQNLQYCRGTNLYLDLRDLVKRKEPFRYKMDVLKSGQIRGKCVLDSTNLKAEATHLSPLQSWAPEIQNFVESPSQIFKGSEICDVFIDKPTYIIKIDATVNMYHHFCDFFNLYASLHINGSSRQMFSQDVNILIWETFSYNSNFGTTWSAFTNNPLWNLRTHQGKRVCFREVIFPLLPRMIFGLYYNTPIIWGCQASGLFHAFSQFILHRLNIDSEQRINNKIKITFLSRKTTYRRVLNEQALLEKLSANSTYEVQRVDFTHETDFKQQLKVIHNTDILIGMHGAGLTHLLFLPDWASVFELYNCRDEHCYADLARLRGVHYETWTDVTKLQQQDQGHHPDGGAHEKFTNYAFDESEFLRIVELAASNVANHPDFLLNIKHVLPHRHEL